MNKCFSGEFFNIPHKFWELQITTDVEGPYFNFQLNWSRKTDHAGLHFLLEIHKFMFDWHIFYDSRHWDYDKKTYIQ